MHTLPVCKRVSRAHTCLVHTRVSRVYVHTRVCLVHTHTCVLCMCVCLIVGRIFAFKVFIDESFRRAPPGMLCLPETQSSFALQRFELCKFPFSVSFPSLTNPTIHKHSSSMSSTALWSPTIAQRNIAMGGCKSLAIAMFLGPANFSLIHGQRGSVGVNAVWS
jgi:hypothetical protein